MRNSAIAVHRYHEKIASTPKTLTARARPRDTRRLILDAAERALSAKGLLGASTREIAREAGVAEGTLYVHFADRTDLFLALIHEHLPPFVEPLKRLKSRAGRRTVRANLAEVLEAAMRWHERLLPVFSAIAADSEVKQAMRQRLEQRGEGPHLSVQAVTSYLIAEQELGRVNPKADPRAVAVMLFGASHFWTSAKLGINNDLGFSRAELIKCVIASLGAGLDPEPKPRAAAAPERS